MHTMTAIALALTLGGSAQADDLQQPYHVPPRFTPPPRAPVHRSPPVQHHAAPQHRGPHYGMRGHFDNGVWISNLSDPPYTDDEGDDSANADDDSATPDSSDTPSGSLSWTIFNRTGAACEIVVFASDGETRYADQVIGNGGQATLSFSASPARWST